MKKFFVLAFLFLAVSAPVRGEELRDVLSNAMEYYNAGDCAEAMPYFESALSSNLSAISQDRELAYRLNYYAGYCARVTDESDAAIVYFKKALELAAYKRDQIPVINTFIGEIERDRGNYMQAAQYYRQALTYVPADSLDAGALWYFIAETYRGDKKFEQSLASCEKSSEIALRNKSVKLEIACLTSNGEIHKEQKDYPQAINKFSQALNSARNAQLPLEMANNHMGLAMVYEQLGKTEATRQSYDEALRLYVAGASTENIPMIIERLLMLPPCTQAQAVKSVDSYMAQADMLLGMDDGESYLYMQFLIGAYFKQAGQSYKSIETYRNIISAAIRGGMLHETARASIALTDVQYEAGDVNGAKKTLQEALKYQERDPSSPYISSLYAKQGWLYGKLGDKSRSEASYRAAMENTPSLEEKEIYAKAIRDI